MGDVFLDRWADLQVCGHTDAEGTERGACSPFIQQCTHAYRHTYVFYVQTTYGMSQRSKTATTPDSGCPDWEA